MSQPTMRRQSRSPAAMNRSPAGEGFRTFRSLSRVLILGFVVACTVSGVLAEPAAAFADYELTIYTTAERDSPAAEGVLRFVQLVEDRTNGRVLFDYFQGGALGRDVETVHDMVIGHLDMVLVPITAYVDLYPRMQTWLLPYLFESEDHLREALSGPVARDFLKELEWHGVQGLAFWSAGFRHVGSSGKAISTLDDFTDLRIGTHPIDVYTQTWQAFGAEPVPTPWQDVPSRLKRGEIVAHDGTPEMFRRARLHETQDHYSLVGYSWMGFLLAANRYRWEDLPSSIRQIMQEAAEEVSEWVARRWAEYEEKALADMEGAGVTVERNPDIEGLKERAQEIHTSLQDESWYDKALVTRIKGLVADE